MKEQDSEALDSAIRHVLEAERRAVEDVERLRARAAQRVQAARAAALAISGRAEQRIARVRAAVDARLTAREREVNAALDALVCADQAADMGEAQIRRAVAAVAASASGSSVP